MRQPTPIRRSLLLAVLVMIVLLGGGILALAFAGSRRAIERVAQTSIRETVHHLDTHLAGFFDPVTTSLSMLRDWGEAGRFDLDDPEALRVTLVPVLERHTQISSLMVADADGVEFMLLQLPDRWLMRLSRPGERARIVEWKDGGAPTETDRDLDYDPRQRPWFQGAQAAAGRVHWTDAYTFFTTKDLGITASVTFGAGNVIGLDVLLNDLSDFTASFANGRRDVLVMTDTRKVIGLPGAIAPAERKASYLKKPEELGIDSFIRAVRTVAGTGLDQVGQGRPDVDLMAVPFRTAGQRWWGAAERYALTRERALWICVVLPEKDLLAGATELRLGILGLTVVVLLIGVMAAFRLANRFSRPIEALVRESDRISQGELDKAEPIESSVMEVLRLAAAHDRMREALQVLFKLEEDLRIARQIQQSTFPDRLPIVKGYDLTAWSDPADETGGDTYDVVGIHRRNGAIRLSQADGERVLLLLGDASGHGIGPALSVTQVRAMLRMAVRRETDLPRIARDMNEQLCADLDSGRFITAWMAQLDPATHTLLSLSAGQGPLLHYRAGRDDFETRNPDTPPLGILAGIDMPDATPIALGRGDIFVVFSDGIFEAADGDGGLFGMERVQELVRKHRKESADDILHAIRAAVTAFTKGAPATDDRTAVIVKRH